MNIDGVMETVAAASQALASQMKSHMESCRTADPLEPYMGENGELWDPVGATSQFHLHETCAPYVDEGGLKRIRQVCRHFAKSNPFAINAHRNRASYIIGNGFTYQAADRFPDSSSEEQRERVQNVVDEFLRLNKWRWRQGQNLLRRDRDGEAIIRKFLVEDGILRVRYVAPAAMFTPDNADPERVRFGIELDPEDEETVLKYYIQGRPVEPEEIQHRKRTDDPRGAPIMWPIRRHLVSALKILRNGSTVTEIQTAIGMIRKFVKATQGTVQAWAGAQNQKAKNEAGASADPQKLQEKFDPGTILNAAGNVEYEFPGMAVDPSKYVDALQAELRACGACLILAEFMFTMKTNESNLATALASESPVTRNFQNLQLDEIESDEELMEDVLTHAENTGLLRPGDREAVRVKVTAPPLEVRDLVADASKRETDMRIGILSPQTASAEAGYSYEEEQVNIETHLDRSGGIPASDRPDDFLTDDDEDSE